MINVPVSPRDFVLAEHLCENCRKDTTTMKLIITRANANAAWGLESAQPLRVNFNVPGQPNDTTDLSSSS